MGAIHINWIHLCYFTLFSFSESKEGIVLYCIVKPRRASMVC